MAHGSFQVYVGGNSGSVEDWGRALHAGKEGLPELTAEQKEVAKRFGATEEQYARMVLVGEYAEKKLVEKAKVFGLVVEEILDGLGPGYRLVAVKREVDNATWVLRIETPESVKNVPVSWELVDDFIDSPSMAQVDFLKGKVLTLLDRKDLLPE